jgi:V8-like Glu-specific endopeptidase
MINRNMLMTNDHCVDSQAVCDSASIVFDDEKMPNGQTKPWEQHRCVKWVDGRADEDWAILELAESPGDLRRWGHLIFANREPEQREAVAVVEHPGAEVKKVSKTGCKVEMVSTNNDVNEPIDLAHSCDTVTGSSGAPLLDSRGEVLGVHHLGFASGWENENRAVRTSKIYEEIKKYLSND